MNNQSNKPSKTAKQPFLQGARWPLSIVALAILVRLLFILVLDPHPSFSGGDVGWYMDTGYKLYTNTMNSPVQTGPVYLLYVGFVQSLLPRDPMSALRVLVMPFHSTIIPPVRLADPLLALRLLNMLWHSILIIAVYRIGARYFNVFAARLAALIIAISPAFVIEAGTPLTESLFMALIFGALALYALCQEKPGLRIVALIGVLLGIATLTRVVVLLFPVLLVIHLLHQNGWRRGLQLAAVLLITYGLTVSTWTIYNIQRWNRFIIGGEGLTAFAWMGVTGVTNQFQVDQALGSAAAENRRDDAFIQGFLDALRRDLPGWVARRAAGLAGAYLQPHNTVYFPGESLKSLAANWLKSDRSLAGLLRLTQGDAFWPKLALYLFHYWALLCGALGLLAQLRRNFWRMLPLYGYVVYTSAVHFVLLANPRYLFPLEPVFYLFAASASIALVQFVRHRAPRHSPLISVERSG